MQGRGCASISRGLEHTVLHALGTEKRPPARQHAGIDARPAKLAGEASIFDLRAAVHHHLETSVLGELRGLVVAYAELHPHHLGADADRLARDAERRVGRTENVDDVTRLFYVDERGIDLLAEDLFAGLARIDGDDGEALLLEILHGEIAR